MGFDDPYFQPPTELSDAEARAYEEKIVELLRDALLPSAGPVFFVEAVELRGKRPDTEVIIRYRDSRKAGLLGRRSRPWQEFIESWQGHLPGAASIGSAIYSRWHDGTLEPVTEE
ncbi:MAG TPA: hypothetical protein VF032_11705 [Thermoleophilaceae bacterium]